MGKFIKQRNQHHRTKYENKDEIHTRLYHIWVGIKYRCNNKKAKCYSDYGGRGIKICKEWQDDYCRFKNWALNNGYKEELSIDRIDNNGNYEPNNCRWVTAKIQANNKRNNVVLEYNGFKLTIAEIAEKYNISSETIRYRYKIGWSLDKIINTPVVGKTNMVYNGKELTLMDIANKCNMSLRTVASRYYKGWNAERIINTPVKLNKVVIEYNDEMLTLVDIANKYNIPIKTVKDRYHKRHWDIDKIINTPVRKYNKNK